jgi:hypothetical protein
MTLRHAMMLGALAVLPALQSPALAARTYTLTGDDVAIWDPAGEVRIEAATGNAVEVEVSLMGADAADLKVSDQALGGRPTLRVLYPGHTIIYPPMGRWSNSNTTIRDDGTWGDHVSSWSGHRLTVKGGGSGTEAWADIVVRVPKGRKVSVFLDRGLERAAQRRRAREFRWRLGRRAGGELPRHAVAGPGQRRRRGERLPRRPERGHRLGQREGERRERAQRAARHRLGRRDRRRHRDRRPARRHGLGLGRAFARGRQAGKGGHGLGRRRGGPAHGPRPTSTSTPVRAACAFRCPPA